jgi:hypothetical protein
MSAYVVEDETINRIVAHLESQAMGRDDWGFAQFMREQGYTMGQRADRERLANAMFALNVRAVEERYGEGEAAKFRPLDFAPRGVAPVGLLATYRALQCWLYQCSEGDVEASALFRLMSQLSDRMAHAIVRNMREYQNGDWG